MFERVALTSASSPSQMFQFQDLEVYGPSESFKKKLVVWKLPTFCPSLLRVDSSSIIPEMTKIISNDTPSTEAQAVMKKIKVKKILRCEAESALRRSQAERACHTRTWQSVELGTAI